MAGFGLESLTSHLENLHESRGKIRSDPLTSCGERISYDRQGGVMDYWKYYPTSSTTTPVLPPVDSDGRRVLWRAGQGSDVLSIAPMVQWTDRYWRAFFRQIARYPLLYTEMIVDKTILYNTNRLLPFLGHALSDDPLALQFGGNKPIELSEATAICVSSSDYVEINLNAGCPSNKAKRGGFGAELMLIPDEVRELCSAMQRAIDGNAGGGATADGGLTGRALELGVNRVDLSSASTLSAALSSSESNTTTYSRFVHNVPKGFASLPETPDNAYMPSGQRKCGWQDNASAEVLQSWRSDRAPELTVKCRLGVTGKESWDDLLYFVDSCRSAGVRKMIIHSRVCILNGLSPQQNRTVPPLRWDDVHRLAEHFPDMRFVLNGGLSSDNDFEVSRKHLGWCSETTEDTSEQPHLHGVMIGRDAYNHPFNFSHADEIFYGTRSSGVTRGEALRDYLKFAMRAQEEDWVNAQCCSVVRPLHHLFHGLNCNGFYKIRLDELLRKYSKDIDSRQMGMDELMMLAIEGIDDEYLLSTSSPSQ